MRLKRRNNIVKNGQSYTSYRANTTYGLPVLLAPLLAIPALLQQGFPPDQGRAFGFLLFVLIALGLVALPFFSRLEIGNDVVSTYLLNYRLLELRPSDIQAIHYGNLFHGGLGFGKGLTIRVLKNGRSRTTSLGDAFWGKEVIADVKRMLESQKKNVS
jgi:hypothetical protein